MINAISNTDIFPLSSIKVNDIKRRRHQFSQNSQREIEIKSKVFTDGALDGKNDTLSLIYTPGVAYVAQEISGDKSLAYEYTSKWNNVAITSDGSGVLGLGNVGARSSLSRDGR